MANPRRSSLHLYSHHTTIPLSDHPPPPSAAFSAASLSSIATFLKRPSAFPFLLSFFLLLTWLSLRLQRSPASSPLYYPSARAQSGIDADANLARFPVHSLISRDRRGWLLNPISAAADAGLHGGAQFCKSIHAGGIQPGGIRGNHRHFTCNETFLIWGAETKFRLENPRIEGKGFAEVIISADEVGVAASSSGTAHALINVDHVRATFFLGCQDNIIDYNSSTTDYRVWKDLLTS